MTNDNLKIYAMRGVSQECPENTLSAISAAVCQGYDGVVVDVQVTLDGIAVLGRLTNVSGMTYEQAAQIPIGGDFSHKFRNERIPSVRQALEYTEAAGLQVCLVMDLVRREQETDVLRLVQKASNVMICFSDFQRVIHTAQMYSEVALGYMGELDTAMLQDLSAYSERVTVWTQKPQTISAWHDRRGQVVVTCVERYARLDELRTKYNSVSICSSGTVKPDIRRGYKADVHIHSEHSQDSTCPISDIYKDALGKGMDMVSITDHCDIHPNHDEQALLAFRKQVVTDIQKKARNCQDVKVLVGVEIGGGFLEPEVADHVVAAEDYDVVIGSVHGIMFRGERRSTSKFDFGSVDGEAVLEYLDGYMDAEIYIAEKLDIDVLAHLTYIFRYINGKYGCNLSWTIQKHKIQRVLCAIIERGIPLEINTSCVGGAYDEWLPAREIVDMYLEMGGYLFTLGSDAHVSDKIGTGFEQVKNYLREKGIRYLVYFENRILHQYMI